MFALDWIRKIMYDCDKCENKNFKPLEKYNGYECGYKK